MYNESPKPWNKPDTTDGLFVMDETITVVKSVETPMQRQRRLDGTPHTVTGVMCDRPQGPQLTLDGLGGLEKSYHANTDDKDEDCDSPDDVMKAYMDKND